MADETFNAFISYAWVDNEPFEPGQPGWVGTFVDRLRKHLARELGRRVQGERVWLDYERMRGSDNVNDAIRAKLESSRLLVPILSTGYLASPWCREELEIFLGLHGPDSGRIFPVWMSPTDDPPSVFSNLFKYKLWYEDERRRPRTRWFPTPEATDREYGQVQQDMARDMAARLRELFAAEPAPEPQPAPEPPQSAPQLRNDGPLVLINGGEGDAELVRTVHRRLHQEHGVGTMLPLSALPNRGAFKSSDLTRDLREKLKLATAVLMVYRDGPAHQVHAQIAEYLKHSLRRPKDRPPPTLDLCQAGGEELDLGFHPAQMRVHCVDGDCAGDCVRRFLGSSPP